MEGVLTMSKERLRIAALGGVHEIGKNMYFLQYGDDIVAIDCGSKFPDESLLGIDLIIPDVAFLLENIDKVRALVVTHGHEDHIGGIPYLLKQLNIPLYASRLTLGLIENKLKEHGLLRQASLNCINSDSILTFGQITTSFFNTNHSIPDCLGIVFDTPEGTVVHTGDFKFDMTPVNKQYPDIHKMADIGKKVSGFCFRRARMLNVPDLLHPSSWWAPIWKRPSRKQSAESLSPPSPPMYTGCSKSLMPLSSRGGSLPCLDGVW